MATVCKPTQVQTACTLTGDPPRASPDYSIGCHGDDRAHRHGQPSLQPFHALVYKISKLQPANLLQEIIIKVPLACLGTPGSELAIRRAVALVPLATGCTILFRCDTMSSAQAISEEPTVMMSGSMSETDARPFLRAHIQSTHPGTLLATGCCGLLTSTTVVTLLPDTSSEDSEENCRV